MDGGGDWWNELLTFDAEFKFAKTQNSYVQWLGGGGGWWNQLSTFDTEFKFAKIQNSYVWWNQLSTFDAEFKFAKIQNSYVQWGGGGCGVGETNFQLLMLSSNLLKPKIPMSSGWGVGGGGWWNQLSTFDAEFKFAKIQNSYVQWEGGVWVGGTNFQLLMLSSNLLKSKIPMSGGGGGGGLVEPTFNF